jgi:hypothetical protein
MLARYHYHGLIKKYISIFGTLFNNIVIRRQDNAGNFGEKVGVPLAYGPKAKFLSRISGDADFDSKVGVTLPRMGFDMTAFSYDTVRKLNSHNKQWNTHNGKLGSILGPVPYDITFTLYVFVKYAEDGTQIVEQILPAFRPDLTVTLNAMPTMGLKLDIPIILNSVSMEDSYDGDYVTRRAITWTLDFTMKGMIWPNINGVGFGDGYDEGSHVLIRTAITNFHLIGKEEIALQSDSFLLEDSTEFTTNMLLDETSGDRLLLQTSTGESTSTDPVKSYIKKEVGDINPESDEYDIIDTKVFFDVGKSYDPATGQYTAP